jgi:hypothetical protein
VYDKLCRSLQDKVAVAGVVVQSFSLDMLNYAPEISAAMLRRQQAKALVSFTFPAQLSYSTRLLYFF